MVTKDCFSSLFRIRGNRVLSKAGTFLSTQRLDLSKSDAGQNAACVLLYELCLGFRKSIAPAADRAAADKTSLGRSLLRVHFLFVPHLLHGIVGHRPADGLAFDRHVEKRH